MGNWRTVNIQGTIDPKHIGVLKNTLNIDIDNDDENFDWDPLCYSARHPSLCGLNEWIEREQISAIGNLFERDFSVEDVADHCRELIKVAPSLNILIHCGGEYEDLDCVNTIVVKGGGVFIDPPHVQRLMEQPAGQAMWNIMQILGLK